MTPPAMIFAAAALVPAMAGTPGTALERNGLVAVALCNGGGMTIAFGDSREPAPVPAPCCAKGCHSNGNRRRARSG